MFTLLFFCCLIEPFSAVSFIPFGDVNGDVRAPKDDDASYGPIVISNGFRFYDTIYTRLYVSSNGLLSFDSKFISPNASSLTQVNVTLIAPFWCDIDTKIGGDVFYRAISNSALLNDLTIILRKAFFSLSKLKITWAFVATWFQVAEYFGSPFVNNTFQVVIAADDTGQYSFVMFNYENLTWPNRNSINTVAGFNRGNLKDFFTLPGAYTPQMLQLAQKSNVNTSGQWLFRVDSLKIIEPQNECATSDRLQVTPREVFFIGGDDVIITNLCLTQTDNVRLDFEIAPEAQCSFINSTSCYCRIPFLNRIGTIAISLKINDGYALHGFILSRDVPLREEVQGLKYIYTPEQLGTVLLKWNQTSHANDDHYQVSYVYVDDSNTMNTIEIDLQNDAKSVGTQVDLKLILQNTQRRRTRSLSGEVDFSFIGIYRVNRVNETILVKTWITITPIYITYMTFEDANAECRLWVAEAVNITTKVNLRSCWPLLYLDPETGEVPIGFSSFIQDWSCSVYRPELCKLFHADAKVCYKTIAPADDSEYGQTCCYSKDNRLLVGPPNGGSYTSVHPNRNPLLHFYRDTRPYFACCVLSDNCKTYFAHRPSDDGQYWSVYSVAAVTGDPHFYKFNGYPYTLNAYGEYSLLTINDILFHVQIRLLPYGSSGGTVVRAIVLNNGFKSKLQIEIEVTGVLMLVDGVEIEMNDGDLLQFTDFHAELKNDAYQIQYAHGVSVEVRLSDKHDALSILILTPKNLQDSVTGLLKATESADVFILPNEAVFYINSTDDRQIYEKFANSWRINDNTTLFNYRKDLSSSSYANPLFTPAFMSNGISFNNATLERVARTLCGVNKRCLFDVSVTGELSIGKMTIESEETIQKLNSFFSKASKTCVAMGTFFENGKITTIDGGTVLRFSCTSGYCLQGKSDIRCMNGAYDHQIPKCALCSNTQLDNITPTTAVATTSTYTRILFILTLILTLLT